MHIFENLIVLYSTRNLLYLKQHKNTAHWYCKTAYASNLLSFLSIKASCGL